MGKNPSEKLKKQVESRILVLETKMKELMFWNDAKNLTYTGEVDTKLPAREFPSTDNVHHFHPIAFVRQMKLILGNGIPPWMVFALEEYNTYKNIKEKKSPLKERILEYFDISFYKDGNYQDSWCAVFINWCFNQVNEYKNINTGANSLAFDWGPKGNKKAYGKSKFGDGWALGETTEPFYGAVIVLSYSHVAFIVGKNTKKNKYVYLGGNQGSAIKGDQQITFGTVKIGKEYAIMKPKSYKVLDFSLPELNKDSDGNYSTSR